MKPLLSFLLLACSVATPLAHGQSYTVEVIAGTGPKGLVAAINDAGEVAGEAVGPGSIATRPFVRTGGTTVFPSALPGWATGINASGQALITVHRRTDPASPSLTYLYHQGAAQQLQVPGFDWTQGYGLNDHGHVVGSYGMQDGSGAGGSFRYRDGVYSDLPLLVPGGATVGNDINNAGQVTGMSAVEPLDGSVYRAVLIESNGTIHNLGALPGGIQSAGNAINELGQVAGMSYLPPDGDGVNLSRAMLWQGGTMTDLGTLFSNSAAFGIGNDGTVVGLTDVAPGGNARAFVIFPSDGVMRDLNTMIPAGSGWVLERAIAVNASGQIVGQGRLRGVLRAFLLTPAP